MHCLNPISIENPKWLDMTDYDPSVPHWLSVPCGKCVACLQKKRMNWAFRLDKEKLFSTSALFITLTYDNAFLPLDESGLAHVSKRDCQTFLKRLRINVSREMIKQGKDPPTLRYYLSSEYGSKTLRPHYHLLLFNFPIYDLPPYETILKAWNLGLVQVGPLRDGGAAYAAKYIMHPLDNLPKALKRPFSLMSRRPGLGLAFLTDSQKRYFNENKTYITKLSGGRIAPLPRYYRSKIFDEETLREVSDSVVQLATSNLEAIRAKDRRKYGKIGAINREQGRKQAYVERVKDILNKQKSKEKF